jgi:hypothetical protein
VKFTPVFSLASRHSYYANGVCRDLSAVATDETRRLLRNHHSLLHARSDGVLCSIETGDDGLALIGVETSVKLSFHLKLQNAEFGLITDLEQIAQKTPLFVPAAADVSKGGSLQLTSGAESLDRGVFASVELPGSVFSRLSAQPIQFFIDFQAKRARWLYYCVTDMKLAGKDFRLVDLETSGTPLVFSPSNRTDLVQNPDANDSLAAELANRYPSLNRIRFVSDDVVPCQNLPRRLTLQLDGHNFPDILPTPSPRNYTEWPFAKQKSLVQQNALYQVVKYVSYSFSKNGV